VRVIPLDPKAVGLALPGRSQPALCHLVGLVEVLIKDPSWIFVAQDRDAMVP